MSKQERIDRLKLEIEICMDNEEYDEAAFLSIRLLKIMSQGE